MAALAQYRPRLATVLDWVKEEQLPEVLDWAEEAAQYVEYVLIVPKVVGAVSRLPRRIGGKDVVLAYSVPTRYGASAVPLWEFAGWPVHLLGGSPHKQIEVWYHLSNIADVVSVDGNYYLMKAVRYCEYWIWPGQWLQVGPVVDAPYSAFRRSCENIIEAWQRVTGGYDHRE